MACAGAGVLHEDEFFNICDVSAGPMAPLHAVLPLCCAGIRRFCVTPSIVPSHGTTHTCCTVRRLSLRCTVVSVLSTALLPPPCEGASVEAPPTWQVLHNRFEKVATVPVWERLFPHLASWPTWMRAKRMLAGPEFPIVIDVLIVVSFTLVIHSCFPCLHRTSDPLLMLVPYAGPLQAIAESWPVLVGPASELAPTKWGKYTRLCCGVHHT